MFLRPEKLGINLSNVTYHTLLCRQITIFLLAETDLPQFQFELLVGKLLEFEFDHRRVGAFSLLLVDLLTEVLDEQSDSFLLKSPSLYNSDGRDLRAY